LEVEQRSDVRVRLPVVITEETFVVTDQAREHVRSDELEVIRKPLRSRELNCAVETLSATEALRTTASRWITSASVFFSGARTNTAGVKDEVGVAVVERTVFDDVDVVTPDAAASDRDVVADFIFKAGGVFPEALRFQTLIGRSRIRTQVSGAGANTRKNECTRRRIQPVDVEVLVRLDIATACADVEVQRNRGFDELRVVSEHLASAFTGEVPDKAKTRRGVVIEVIELQVSTAVVAVRLLIIPTNTEAELEVLGEFPVVTGIKALNV